MDSLNNSEAEKKLESLDLETKKKAVSSISFILINYLNTQNNLELFAVPQKLTNLLTPENQRHLLLDVNNLIISYLFSQDNIGVFQSVQKLMRLLNEDNKAKLNSDINFIIENFSNAKKKQEERANLVKNAVNVASGVIEQKIPDAKKVEINLNVIKEAPLPTEKRLPAIHEDEISHFSKGAPATHASILNAKLNVNPPPPKPLANTSDPGKVNIPLKLLSDKPILRTSTTSTDSNIIRPKTEKDTSNDVIQLSESIKYIIPFYTERGKNAFKDLSTPVESYQFLKQVDGKASLNDIYKAIYPNLDLINFIYKVDAVFSANYISFKKSEFIPPGKRIKLKIGEWLVLLGFIEKDKLDRIVSLHNLALKNDFNSRRTANRILLPNQKISNHEAPMFGEFLMESGVITQQQLNHALMVQVQFDEIVDCFTKKTI